MVDDDDDSDYGHSKKKGKKVVPRGGRRVEKKDKKSPKPRLKATGNHCHSPKFLFLCFKEQRTSYGLEMICK